MCHCGVVTLSELITSPFSTWYCPVWKGHGLLHEIKSQFQTKLKKSSPLSELNFHSPGSGGDNTHFMDVFRIKGIMYVTQAESGLQLTWQMQDGCSAVPHFHNMLFLRFSITRNLFSLKKNLESLTVYFSFLEKKYICLEMTISSSICFPALSSAY